MAFEMLHLVKTQKCSSLHKKEGFAALLGHVIGRSFDKIIKYSVQQFSHRQRFMQKLFLGSSYFKTYLNYESYIQLEITVSCPFLFTSDLPYVWLGCMTLPVSNSFLFGNPDKNMCIVAISFAQGWPTVFRKPN